MRRDYGASVGVAINGGGAGLPDAERVERHRVPDGEGVRKRLPDGVLGSRDVRGADAAQCLGRGAGVIGDLPHAGKGDRERRSPYLFAATSPA